MVLTKTVKSALLDVLKEQVAIYNDGSLARYRASAQNRRILADAGIRISGVCICRNGMLVASVRRRYSGCRLLTPTMYDIVETSGDTFCFLCD